MCSFGIRLENTNPPHFFCDRNASSFSTVPAKSFHAQVSASAPGSRDDDAGRGCRAFRLDDKTQFSLKLVFDDNYIIADEAWFRITIESWSK